MKVRDVLLRLDKPELKLVCIGSSGSVYTFDSVQSLLSDPGNYIKDCAYKSGFIQPDLLGSDQIIYVNYDVKE